MKKMYRFILLFMFIASMLYSQQGVTEGVDLNRLLKSPNSTRILIAQGGAFLALDSLNFFTFDSIYFTKWNTRHEDLRFPATALDPQNKNDNVPVFDTVWIGFSFDSTETETLFGIAQMPHAWKTGSDLSPHIHWSSEAADTVVWEFGYKWASINDTISETYTLDTIYAVGTDTLGYHKLSDFSNMDGSAITGVSSIIKWKISRLGGHAQDDSDGAALLWEVDFHYQTDAPGSRSEYVK